MACGWRPGTLAGLILLVLLGGCSWMGGSDDPKKQPTRVTYSMAADSMVNPNLSGDATPVEVQVFELEDESMFHNADYEQLVHDARKALKSNYVKHWDYMLIPGQFKFIDAIEISKDSRYIGVMARYEDPNLSDWKKVVRVLPFGRQYHLFMYFKDNIIKLEIVE